MLRVLSDQDVAAVLDLDDLLTVVADAFAAQYRGAVERPERPHFPVGIGEGVAREGAAGTALTMPAYIHGRDVYATKLVAVHDANTERGLPTVNAQIAVTDATTGQPLAFLHGNRVTNARTGCIGGLAVRELTDGPVDLAVIGAGTQARWQTRAIAAATDVERIRVYSPSDSRERCAADLESTLGVPASAVDAPSAAVDGADVVVTATNSTTPVLQAADVDAGSLVVAIGAYTAETRELPAALFDRAAVVYADVPEEVAQIGDLRDTGLTANDMVPFGRLFADPDHEPPTPTGDEILVVESVGTAVLDAAAAEYVLGAAEGSDVGERIDL